MKLNDNEIKIFVHRDMLLLEVYYEKLKNWLYSSSEHLNHTIIRGINEEDGELDIVYPTEAQQKLSDISFEYFVEQKVQDGFLHGSLETFKKFVS